MQRKSTQDVAQPQPTRWSVPSHATTHVTHYLVTTLPCHYLVTALSLPCHYLALSLPCRRVLRFCPGLVLALGLVTTLSLLSPLLSPLRSQHKQMVSAAVARALAFALAVALRPAPILIANEHHVDRFLLPLNLRN